MKNTSLTFFFLLFSLTLFAQHKRERPKIGLALSGGGAKGISHIGVLQVLEKAGIRVDYIGGTSMGSIIGGLYAIGYSADSIAALIRKEDWNFLLANNPGLEQIVIEEKSEYGKFIVEMPFVKGRFVLPRGLIDGQELSIELSRAFSSIYQKKKFSEFPIPFLCIATDITTGEPVVLDSGNAAEAIRASMAIPSIFTPVKYNNQLLVDGGIVRNFPVSNVKKMGADIVIGSNLSKGFLAEKDLQSVFDILNQSMFLVDNEDTRKQRELCDVLIEPDLTGFGAGSFFSVDSLIQRGYDAAMVHFDRLKHLADSLNKLYGEEPERKIKLQDSVSIESFYLEGIKRVDPILVTGKMALKKNENVSLNEIPNAIRRVWGTRYFKRINYELIPAGKKAKLLIKAEENPNTYFKFAINYNTFTGSALIVNMTSRNLLGKRSRFLTTLNISENFRAKSEYYFYFGPKQNLGFGLGAYYDQNDYPIYQNLVKTSEYKQNYLAFDAKLQVSSLTVNSWGVGIRREFISISPQIYGSGNTIDGGLKQWNMYSYFLLNTQDKVFFPTKGTKTYIQLSYITDVKYKFSSLKQDTLGNRTSIPIPQETIDTTSFKKYLQFKLLTTRAFPLAPAWTMLAGGFAGFTFDVFHENSNQSTLPFNDFIIGGLVQNFRNQIPFVGVNEYQLNSNNFMGGMIGFQYEFLRNFYCTPKFNIGNYVTNFPDYYQTDALFNFDHYIIGYGITLSYSSLLGPLEVTLMHTPQLKSFSTYVNLGYNF